MTSPESPDMDRLREVVADALDARIDRWLGSPDISTVPLADAVLAALLPVHRAMVLRKTQGDPEPCPLDHSCAEDESCGCWCDLHDCALDECPTFKTVEAWIKGMQEKHEAALRRLAASTPPGAPGSPQTAERATPSETGGVEDTGVRELAVAPNVWVSFHGLDFAVAWHSVPGDSYRKVVKVIPHAKTPAAAVADAGDDPAGRERLTVDISRDLRAVAQDMRAERRNTDAVLLTEAADKLDGLIALLAQAETERDRLAADVVQVVGERDGLLRLVASARTLLGQVARTEAVQSADEALAERADGLARRIVDEIGPVAAALWDTPSTGTDLAEERDADAH